jgi:hypothetical protein
MLSKPCRVKSEKKATYRCNHAAAVRTDLQKRSSTAFTGRDPPIDRLSIPL